MTDVVYRIEPCTRSGSLDQQLRGLEVVKVAEVKEGEWRVFPSAMVRVDRPYFDRTGTLIEPGTHEVLILEEWLMPRDPDVQAETDFGGLTVTEFA